MNRTQTWWILALLFLVIFYLYLFGIEAFQVNGEEPNFEPEKWEKYQKYNNCYAYAFDNHKKRDSKPQPADNSADKYKCSDLENWIIKDLVDRKGKRYPLINGSIDKACPKEYHKIYLVTSGDDYHFYRLDRDGKWSHKPGSTKVTREDANGNTITDPSKANHDYGKYNYKMKCGFYCVPKIDEKF